MSFKTAQKLAKSVGTNLYVIKKCPKTRGICRNEALCHLKVPENLWNL
jgi:hypothetical protein